MTKYPVPIKPGFYWAKWKIADDGPKAEEYRSCLPNTHWEVMDVFANHMMSDKPDYLRVFVSGIEHSQSLENFFWGPGPLEEPSA